MAKPRPRVREMDNEDLRYEKVMDLIRKTNPKPPKTPGQMALDKKHINVDFTDTRNVRNLSLRLNHRQAVRKNGAQELTPDQEYRMIEQERKMLREAERRRIIRQKMNGR